MDKHRLHHTWKKLRWIKPWYFLALAIVITVICVFALRANNEKMVKLTDAVYTADKNNADVQGALQSLQAYVTTHMNTSLSGGAGHVYPPIQLKYTYDRLVDAESQTAATENLQLYTEAQHYCEQQDPTDFSGHNRVPCIEQYVETHAAQSLAPIPDALYKFDFVSPTWSPDLAGWSLLVAAFCWILFIITFAAQWWLRRSVRS